MNELAQLLLARDQLAEAECYAAEAVALGRTHYRAGHPRLADLELTLARCHLRAGRADLAEPMLLSCFDALERTYGLEHRATREALEEIVAHFEREGHPEQAEYFRGFLDGEAEVLGGER